MTVIEWEGRGSTNRPAVGSAAAVATEAANLTTGLKSARAVGYIRDLDTALAPHSNNPTVREFREFVSEQITTARLLNA